MKRSLIGLGILTLTVQAALPAQAQLSTVVTPTEQAMGKVTDKVETVPQISALKAMDWSVRKLISTMQFLEQSKTTGVVIGAGSGLLGFLSYGSGALASGEMRFGNKILLSTANKIAQFVDPTQAKPFIEDGEEAAEAATKMLEAPQKFNQYVSKKTGVVLMGGAAGETVTWLLVHDYAFEGFIKHLQVVDAQLRARIALYSFAVAQ